MGDSESEDEEEFEDSRENLSPRDTIGPSSTQEQAPLPTNIIMSSQPSSSSHSIVQSGVSQDTLGGVHHKGVMDHADLIEDTKFYQDSALDYQNTYKALHAQQVELQGKYSLQAYPIKDASAAIKAEAQCQHQELLDAQHNRQAEIESAVSRAASDPEIAELNSNT